ncbi:cytochrome c peroxidase [Larkinella soli]|uniref:cytochrome c peroxidase n=1 Tax=Larkinella soli TaxID=1770527 RepID=UPI000FFB38E8|nr:cytochrome c peroxidase [Larkinella soli]
MKRTLLAGLALLALVAAYFGFRRSEAPAATTVERVQRQFLADVAAFETAVAALKKTVESGDPAARRTAFLQTRLAWKQVEWLAEYYFPATAKAINGAPIPEYEESDAKTIAPEGLQVIEPLLFPAPDPDALPELKRQVAMLQANARRLNVVAQNNPMTDAHLFDALRLEVFRIVSLGITGFDAPVALSSLPEARVAVRSLRSYLAIYRPALERKDPTLAGGLEVLSARADGYLKKPTGAEAFNRFDRMAFITEIANPLGGLLLDAQKALGFEPFRESRGLRADARTLFDAGAFSADHYAPGPAHRTTPARVLLGRKLFFDPVLSGDGNRSCAGCHQPDRAFTDGLARNLALDGRKPIRRNTPTLWNVGLQRALFADSRVSFLEDQATDVVTNADEMHGSFDKVVAELKNRPAYAALFANAYTDGVTSFNIRNALAAYQRTLIGLNSRFDRYVRGERSALNAQEVLGFNLFAGKGRCATCHFLPLTNGLVPPHFEKSESENLGVPERFVRKGGRLDPDRGKGGHNGAAIHQHLFKTPTVRNVALTAPYMHNGAFGTLEEVVDFYDLGGGRGIGIHSETQTLSENRLNLDGPEKAALVAFMKALTDTTAVVSPNF